MCVRTPPLALLVYIKDCDVHINTRSHNVHTLAGLENCFRSLHATRCTRTCMCTTTPLSLYYCRVTYTRPRRRAAFSIRFN